MPTTVNDGEFLTYSKYNELKGYFGTDKKNMPIYVKLSDIFPNTNIKEEDQKKYHSAFSELLRHINNGHVFYNYNKEGCWYMSYILYKEVDRVLTHDYDTYVYKLLQEFILKFNQHRSSKSNTCIKEFSHINSDTYKIMNELYTLYDEYTKYKNISKYNIPNNCENFSNFIHLYNIFLNSYVSGTDFFNEILKHFDTEIRKSITNYDIYECKKYPYHLSKLNLYTRPEPKQPIDPVPLEQQQTPNVLARAGLQNSHHDVAHPPVTQLGEARREEAEQENQVAEGKQETAYGQKLTRNNVIPPEQGRVFKPEGAHKAESSREHGITHGYRSTYNHRGEEETLRAGLSPYSQAFATPGSSVHQELSDVSSFSPKLDIKTEDDGVFANVRSTITNVLGQVEPAPILGVSGGMGALFLLFKYTPVGSFFGGRRGRIRQIPSSFRGFPPGDFANFQEYDGGFIGYGPTSISSLAE